MALVNTYLKIVLVVVLVIEKPTRRTTTRTILPSSVMPQRGIWRLDIVKRQEAASSL